MKIGQILNNKYEILLLIGQGGISSVYLTKDINTNNLWAVKEYNKNKIDNSESYIYAILNETKIISSLSHFGIPRIIDIINTDNSLIIIMDYIEGKTLDKIIQESGTFSEQVVINLANQIIDIFLFIHSKNIIYRDLKPSNIILTPVNQIKLIDFGIAREFSPKKEKDTRCLGTIGYAAPEQYGGKGQSDFRTDIYSFGLTLFYMLTAISPMNNALDSFSIKNINSNFSYGLDFIITKCTQLEPNNRYQTFDEIKEDFQNIEFLKLSFFKKWEQNLKNTFFWKKYKSKNIRNKPPKPSPFIDIQNINLSYETVILAGENINSPIPDSVMDTQNIHIFLSYCHKDSDLADIICEKLTPFSFISISRYTTGVPYKSSFIEFMNTLGVHDKVIMIITDNYLKSKACMYEVGKLINLPNFQNKILFIVCTDKDKKYYKVLPDESIEPQIYDFHKRNQYIIFWENQCELLENDLKMIKHNSAKIEILETIRDIEMIINHDLGSFMKYIADVRGITFDELYQHNFKEFLKELGIE